MQQGLPAQQEGDVPKNNPRTQTREGLSHPRLYLPAILKFRGNNVNWAK